MYLFNLYLFTDTHEKVKKENKTQTEQNTKKGKVRCKQLYAGKWPV